MRRNELQRIVVDTAHDDDGYYFSIDGGECVGPFLTRRIATARWRRAV